MITIKPRTYNEIVRLTRCMAMRKYIPDLTDEKIEEMYRFISEHPQHRIYLTPEMISFVNASGKTVSATVVETANISGFSFDRIVLGAAVYTVLNKRRPTSSSGSGSGCSSCSGCSSNNNNNNNNNNG